MPPLAPPTPSPLILPGAAEFSLQMVKPDRYAFLSVKALVLDSDGCLLIQLRAPDRDDAGHLNLFGGKSKLGETAYETLVRELEEEIGAKRMPARQLVPLTAFVNHKPEGAKLNLIVFWRNRGKPLRRCTEGEILRVPGGRAFFESKQITMWSKWKTQQSVELALAAGLIKYNPSKHQAKRLKQPVRTRRMLAARNKLVLKDYSLDWPQPQL